MSYSWQRLCEFYNNLTLHIVPGPRSVSYFIPFLIVIVSLAVPPRHLSHRQIRWFLLPLFYVIQLSIWQRHKSFDVISMNNALHAFMLLGWYDVRRDFKYVRRLAPESSISSRDAQQKEGNQRDPQTKVKDAQYTDVQRSFQLEAYPSSVLLRLRWIGVLLGSMRMTDWLIGIPSHDSLQPSPIKLFSEFIKETLTQSILAYTLIDFTSPHMRSAGCGTGDAPMAGETLVAQVSRSLLLLAYFYAALSLFTALLPHLISIGALILVPSLRLNSMASPLTWPSHLGPISSIYAGSQTSPGKNLGLRAFWGTFWHQNMRHMTSTPGVALASVLRLSRGSKSRYMVIVASSFFWSGVVHMGVIPPEPVNTRLTCLQMRLLIASFFWLQVVGIGIEELVEFAVHSAIPGAISGGTRPGKKGASPVAGQEEDTAVAMTSKNGVVSLARNVVVLTWTVGFLALTAWLTVLPVACEMGWLNINLIPVTVPRMLKL